MAYLGKTPSQAVRSRYYYTATGGETSLSGADDNSNVLTFTDGNYVDVSLNGATLVAGSDYNTTTANTIGGLVALTASDVVEVVVYDTFSVFGGNMAADLNFKDNVKANFGTGNDLQIFHDGSNSIIRDAGTGSLKFQYGTTDGVVFDSSGNVGLGTSSPAVALDIVRSSSNAIVNIDGQSAANRGALLRLKKGGTDTAYIGQASAILGGGSTDNDLVFWADGAIPQRFYINASERMRIDTSGNVGIGTASPARTLSAYSSSSILARIESSTTDSQIEFVTSGGTTNIGGFNGNIVALTGGSERMRIDSSGNVGIGTSSPSSFNGGANNLVVGSGSGSEGITIYADNASNSAVFFADTDSTTTGQLNYQHASNAMTFHTNGGTERMRIDSNGNVMVGGTTAGNAGTISLNVGNVGSTTGGLQLWSTTAGTHYVQFGDESGTAANHYRGFMAYAHNVDSLTFGTASTERMRIDSSGNLLVGTTGALITGTAKLSVNGQIEAVTSSTPVIDVARSDGAGTIINLRQGGGAVVGSIGTTASDLCLTSNNVGFRMDGSNNHIIPVNDSLATRDAAIDLGYSGGRFKDLYLSGGVYLGGTGSANLLDSYEEGSFVPYVSLTYNPSGRTITDNGAGVGRYTKIGNIVQCEIIVGWTGISGSGAVNVGINNLPFTKATDITVVNGVARSNVTGIMFVMESVTGTQVNVIRKYDNGSPNDVDSMNCFIVYRAA